jgi:hypothetical protein
MAFFLVGLIFGLVPALAPTSSGKGELYGGLLAGLGFVLWAIVQFLGAFSSESGRLGFGETFGYVWLSIIFVVLGLSIGFVLPKLRKK